MRLIVLLIVAALWNSAFCMKIERHDALSEKGYKFWLAQPFDTTDVKPLFIFLHGASLRGKDLNRVKRYGTINALEKGLELDAYVMAPQVPVGSWNAAKINEILEWSEQNYKIDTTRVYVLGMSLGGHGTLDFAANYPEKVAAAIAICGGNIMGDVAPLLEVPLWIIHGTADRAVKISSSDRLVENMKKIDAATPRLKYTRVKGVDHSRPARLFYNPKIYEWLLSHSLSDEGRPAAETFIIDSSVIARSIMPR